MVENYKSEPPEKSGLNESEIEEIKKDAEKRLRDNFLDGDSINALPQGLILFDKENDADLMDEIFAELAPVLSYEEYYRKKHEGWFNSQKKVIGEAEAKKKKEEWECELFYIMQLSDKNYIAQFDAEVEKFNKDLKRIKQEKDIEAVNKFINTVRDIVNTKKNK